MSIVRNEFTMVLSSAAENGAVNISAFGNAFDTFLNQPIQIPRDCINPKLALVSANVWNSASNISPSFNNNELALNLGGTPLLLTFPSGLYSLSAINSYVSNQLVLNGFASGRVAFDANYATSQVGAYLTVVGDQIDFSGTNSIGKILGFSPIVVTCTVPNTYIFSSGKAELNRVNAFLLSTSLLGGQGIPINNNNSSILALIPITAGPNELITYSPQHLTSVGIDSLKGQTVNNISVALLDQLRRPVDTNSEDFEMLIRFSWDEKR